MSRLDGRIFYGLLIAILAITMYANVLFVQAILIALLAKSPELRPYQHSIINCIEVGSFFIVLPPYVAVFDMFKEKSSWSVSKYFTMIWINYVQIFVKTSLIIIFIPVTLALLFLIPLNLGLFCFTLILFIDNLIGLLFRTHMSAELLSHSTIFLLGVGCLVSGTSLYFIWRHINWIMEKVMAFMNPMIQKILAPRFHQEDKC